MIAKQKIHGFVAAFDYNNQKMELKNKNDRAELLDHNFFKYDRQHVLKEIVFLRQLRPNLTRDAYHVSLNFAPTDQLTSQQLVAIGRDYLAAMGFGDNAYAIWQHFDADHLHIHLLASRIRYDGSVVSDSNNYQRSEKICRELELKYDLENVRSSKEALDRAPSKDELEMIQRTGTLSNRMLMQERVKAALSNAHSISDFIAHCERNGVYLIFNQSESTGRISGVTYISADGFLAKGQKLGNQYKWSNLLNKLNYEQSRDRQTIGETNNRTRARFKNLLEKSSRGAENGRGIYIRTPNNINEEPRRITSKDEHDFSNGYQGRSYTDDERADRNEEAEQEIEETVSNKFSGSASSVISGFGSLLGSIGSDEVDEDQKRRKRRSKR